MSKSIGPKVRIARVREMVANDFHQSVPVLPFHRFDDPPMVASPW
jgi:hypothetical protein